jgi:N-sulfoglucosamine sulfohydrolase
MGALGTAGIRTPHMDALARSGVLFRQAFVAYPICSASKAAIYTGLHNHTTGLLNNTANFMKPAAQLTAAEKNLHSYRTARVVASAPTLVERLKAGGWHQVVTSKLHVAPQEKFPYDEFLPVANGKTMAGVIVRAARAGKPWHLWYNIGASHRPFPNSDKVKIRVKPAGVKLPAFLPDTPVIRQDWAEYLAAIELADRFVGEALAVLRETGQEQNTIIMFMGDHGPCFAHGKMTMHDLGLRVPLIIRAPGGRSGVVSDAPVSELDLTPTLLDLLGLAPLPKSHGVSLRGVIEGKGDARPREFVFAEISDKGPLPNDGMQERSIYDGRWHLIARDKVETRWRQVQADNKFWKTWGNRSYDETVRVKAQFPEAFRILAEMDPQSLGGNVPALELYDLQSDPDELRNLARDPSHRGELERLHAALEKWRAETQDMSFTLPVLPR